MSSRKYNKKDIEKFCLMDDPFMKVVFRDRDCTQYLVDTTLGEGFEVTEVTTQYHIENIDKRSVVLDIYAKDKDNNICNIEVQNDNEGAEPKRARYHSSLIDMNSLEKSTNFSKLPETYVIFITRNDILGGNKPIYHIDKVIKETNTYFNDDAHIIYVNSTIQDDTPLGRLMHDFYCTNAKDMNSSILAEHVRYFKETEKGVDTMCTAMQEIVDEEMKREATESVRRLYAIGHNLKVAYEVFENIFTFDEVKAICEEEDKKQTSSTSSQYTHNFT